VPFNKHTVNGPQTLTRTIHDESITLNSLVIRVNDLRWDFDCLHLHTYCPLSITEYSLLLGFNASWRPSDAWNRYQLGEITRPCLTP